METITEIVNAETARRVRARDYEDAKNRVENLQRRVLTLKASNVADTAARLRRILEEASALPEDVIGSVGGLVPISGVVRTFITALASDALKTFELKDERRRAELKAAETDLKSAEAVVATFGE